MLASTDFHLEFASLRVKTSAIGITSLVIEQKVSTNALNALIFEPNNIFSWTSKNDLAVYFCLERENEYTFKAKHKSRGILLCNCVNCLKNLEYDLSFDFSMRLILGNENEELSTDISFNNLDLVENPEEFMVSYFLSDTIDLGILLREQIFMTIPDYPKCNEGNLKSPCQMQVIRALENKENLRENPFVKHFKKAV